MRTLYRDIEQNSEALCTFLQELVRIPTVNPPGRNYEQIVGFLEEHCRSLGMKTRTVRVPDETATALVPHAEEFPRFNLIARWDVGSAKTVHFNAHYDVVPAAGQWKHDPFGGEIAGDWLFGRGANDMKDSIAALLFAIRALQDCGKTPACNVECSFTCDEETGGDLGAGYLARAGLIDADYVVNCEGGSGLNVGVGHNGVLWLEVTVHGRAAHASRPEKGLNAFEKTAALVSELQSLKRRFEKPERLFTTPIGVERRPTMNLAGVFRGTEGDKVNTVPARVTFSIDRRIPPNESLRYAEDELRDAIADACDVIPELRVDVTRLLGIEPCTVNPDDPFVQAFVRAVRKVRRHPIRLSSTTGFTDLHFLIEDGARVGVGYGPRGEGGHAVDERVKISDLIQTAKVYATFMVEGLHEIGDMPGPV